MSDVFEFVPKHGQTSRIADFAEAQCLNRDDLSVSIEDISNDLERASLNDDDAQENHLEDADVTPEVVAAFDDLEERPLHCGGDGAFYPFRLFGDGGQIAARNDCGERWHSLLYLFLLWLTLTKQKALDARALFERLCCEVARNYLGGDPAGKVSAIHFGESGNFAERINHLTENLGEGGGFREDSRDARTSPKDDGVDIVVHRRFADKRAGQLIGFGQCKTGRSYNRSGLNDVNIGGFMKTWLRGSVAVDPVRMFFLSDRIAGNENMAQKCREAGILFDRCRVMEYAENVDSGLKAEIKNWILNRLGEAGVLDRLARNAR